MTRNGRTGGMSTGVMVGVALAGLVVLLLVLAFFRSSTRAVGALWFFLTAPAHLMSILWPILVTPLALGALAALVRPVIVRRAGAPRFHPLMQSPFAWPALVVVVTFVPMWLLASAVLFLLTLLTMVR